MAGQEKSQISLLKEMFGDVVELLLVRAQMARVDILSLKSAIIKVLLSAIAALVLFLLVLLPCHSEFYLFFIWFERCFKSDCENLGILWIGYAVFGGHSSVNHERLVCTQRTASLYAKHFKRFTGRCGIHTW